MARRQKTWGTEEAALLEECRTRPYCPRALAKYAGWLKKQRRKQEAAHALRCEKFLIRRRNRIVEKNLGLISVAVEKAAFIIHQQKGNGRLNSRDRLSPEDAWSAGAVALMRSAELWHPSHGRRFSTYSVAAMTNEILSACNTAVLIHIPEYLRKSSQADHRHRFEHEAAIATGIRLFSEMKPKVRKQEDEELPILAPVPKDLSEIRPLLPALKRLSKRRRQVIELRFYRGYTLKAAALELGITHQTVLAIEKAALAQLRDILESS